MNLRIILFVLILVLIPISTKADLNTTYLNEYNILFELKNNLAKVRIEFEINCTDGADFGLTIPKKADNISLFVDGKLKKKVILQKKDTNILLIPLTNESKSVAITYEFSGVMDKLSIDYFLGSVVVPFDTQEFSIKIKLPTGAILSKSIQEEGAIDPKPSSVETDGQCISIIWRYEDVIRGFKLTSLTQYKPVKGKSYINPALFALSIIILIILTIKYYPKNDVEIHLKENEKIIVRALKMKGGRTSQSTLQIVTDFPKSTLCDLLMELEERKIIYKQKKGKKNIIILKKDVPNNLD
ncbi:MAG: hypothetical protein ABIC04_04745 [Nanoarchaeota archaeon]